MPEFTVDQHIDAPVEKVWEVLNDFGGVHKWGPGIKSSELTSDGDVGQGSTRRCDFAPFGGVNERIERHELHQRMTINLYETFKLPISSATADFNLETNDGGTDVTVHYSYQPNLMGRLMRGYTDKQMRKGISGMARALSRESERIHAA